MESPVRQRSTLTVDDVISAYRFILGREPESDAAIGEKLVHYQDRASLREALLASPEFSGHGSDPGIAARINPGYWSAAQSIEYRVSGPVLAMLTERIRQQWTALGEQDPYWSVLTDERYRAAALDRQQIDSFRQTGANSASLLDLIGQKGELPPPHGVCLELGCGVGRITRHLAPRFDKVIAVDISPGNLAICERYMHDENIQNVDTVLIESIETLNSLPDFDYFYSMIVLQHNPPPVQYEMLRILFSKVRRGGVCLFQTACDMPGYSFDAADYLASEVPEMEVHSLPMPAIFSLMHEAGLQIHIARMDAWVDCYGSYTFGAIKP
jgi:SAM-dependent methyltransferase